MKTWNDSVKKSIRPHIVAPTGRVATWALFMPAETAHCVREALKQGTIDEGTHLVLVDRNAQTLAKAVDVCEDMGFGRITAMRGEVGALLTKMAREQTFLFDFVYLDVCGELTPGIRNGIRDLYISGSLQDDAVIAFTFMTACRRYPHTARHLSTSHVAHAMWHPVYSLDEHRQLVCQTFVDTIRHQVDGATVEFGTAYKEKGKAVPMMSARIRMGRDTQFADLGYN
jgi:hypothetical protein